MSSNNNKTDNISINSIYYDHFRNKIYLRETINGQVFTDCIQNQFEYYVEDSKNESNITDIYGKKFIKKYANNRETIRLLKDSGVSICESDISQDIKFLHSRYKGRILNPNIKDFQIATIDLEIETGSEFPKADEAKYPINLITIHLSRQNKTYTFGNREYEGGKENYKCISNEKEMLESFIDFFIKSKATILTGFNINFFDIPYIINRCKNLGIEKQLSNIGNYYQNRRTGEWSIPGVAALDFYQFYKDPKFVQDRLESYTLQFICMKELGEGKLELDGFINDAYKKDWKKFVDYNIQDTILCVKLEAKMKFIELAITMAHDSLIPIDKIFAASTVIEGQILNYLHDNNMVMNDRSEGVVREELEGAYVESQPGYFENNISYDFEGLYPALILHYNISPETLVINPNEEEKKNLIKTPISESHGIWYKKEEGIFPKILKINIQKRNESKDLKKKYFKEKNDELYNHFHRRQLSKKIFNNSFYGVMSLWTFHYYNINNAKTVTWSGQHIIKNMRDKLNLYFNDYFPKDKRFFKEELINFPKRNRIIVLDTDSIFLNLSDVKEKIAKDKPMLDWANGFNTEIITPMLKKLLDNYFKQFGVENKINFKIEKIISQMIVFGDKNYVTKILSNEGDVYPKPKFEVTGFSSKRSSTPNLCRLKINEVLEKFFNNPDRKYMLEIIKEVKKHYQESPIEDIAFPKGITDYKKWVPRNIEYYVKNGLEYEKAIPVHCRASQVYNYLVHKYQLQNQPINSGSKLKYFYVHENNELKTNIMGFLGNCPEYIKQNFKIDYEQMFQVSFIQPMQKLFDVMNWGLVDIENVDISNFFD